MKKKLGKQWKSIISLSIIIFIFLKQFFHFQNNHLQVSHYQIPMNDLEEMKIVHLSNLHDKEFGFCQRKLIQKVKKCHPNYIFLTRDMYDLLHKKFEQFYESLGLSKTVAAESAFKIYMDAMK